MRDAAVICRDRGLAATTWQDLKIEGRLLIDPILEEIDHADACVAEISSANPNVLFEAGYALARNKPLYLALDETDNEANKAWEGLALVDTVGRVNYGGSAQVLAERLVELMTESRPPLMESLLAGARPREENAVFAPGTAMKFTAAERLESLLERNTHLKLLATEEEVGFGPLNFYAQEIYRSSAVILHFIKHSRVRADVYNSQVSLLAGIAHGMELPLLMVGEEGYVSPLDYRDLLYIYSSTAKLTDHVQTWLDSLPSPGQSNKRLGRLKLDIELPIRSFGQYVAESEKDTLTDYFVQTNEFSAVMNGQSAIFAGRKGTGKTATMQQAVEELRRDRRLLVVPLKPSSYDLSGLLQLLARFDDPSRREYFLVNLWSFLIVSEVAIRALKHADELPAGTGADAGTAQLASTLGNIGVDLDSDMTSRLDEVVDELLEESRGDEVDIAGLTDSLKGKWRGKLLGDLRQVLHRYDRVAVLIDNLDKTWEKGVDFSNLSHFILSLLITSGKLQGDFAKEKAGKSVRLTLTIFLRTDIYDVLKSHAREPDKISVDTIEWRDEELLIRVLEDRYIANRSGRSADIDSLWVDVFAPEVQSMATRDYLLWRPLPRHRDLIFIAN